MKAAVLYEPNTPLVIEELELAEPASGEVLVKMMASGVCHSDWHLVKGDWDHMPMPLILGHEGAGIVEATGPNVTALQVGDHVVGGVIRVAFPGEVAEQRAGSGGGHDHPVVLAAQTRPDGALGRPSP